VKGERNGEGDDAGLADAGAVVELDVADFNFVGKRGGSTALIEPGDFEVGFAE
jgi:hypothetical protein